MGYIYKISNKINNKCYIGSTIDDNYEIIWKNILNTLYGLALLKIDINKYSINNFTLKILIICFDKDIEKFKEEYIKNNTSQVPYGYNIFSQKRLKENNFNNSNKKIKI